jgi:hypothetical protein
MSWSEPGWSETHAAGYRCTGELRRLDAVGSKRCAEGDRDHGYEVGGDGYSSGSGTACQGGVQCPYDACSEHSENGDSGDRFE